MRGGVRIRHASRPAFPAPRRASRRPGTAGVVHVLASAGWRKSRRPTSFSAAEMVRVMAT